jgi:hypothetical protein
LAPAEQQALIQRDEWPPWLRIALELNYLAEIASDPKAAASLYVSAIDCVIANIRKQPSSIVSKLHNHEKRELIKGLTSALEGHGFTSTEIQRVVNRALEAEAESHVNRVVEGLAVLGITSDDKDVKEAIRSRSQLVHPMHNEADANEVLRSIGLLRDWTQRALQALLKDGRYLDLK